VQRFSRQFLASLGILAPVLIAVLAIWTRVAAVEPPARPAFPIPGREFVAEYGLVGADAAHLIYYWGLFGMAAPIRNADLLLLGSSHTQFGLSARQLSARLSRVAGRPVPVFNLGTGCGESTLFGASILHRLGVRGKAVVADMYNTDVDTPCGDAAVHADPFDAYFKVLAIWSKFTWDWLLDGNLPALVLRDGRAAVSPFLAGSVVILDWRFGDAVYCARPSEGRLFPVEAGQRAYPADDYGLGLPRAVPVDPKLRAVLAAQQTELRLTLIPFSGDRDYLPQLHAPDRGDRSDAPFISLSGRGLSTFDHNHLTADSRAVATDRLLQAIAQDGLLARFSGSARPPLDRSL
jgi:hypothetical protein